MNGVIGFGFKKKDGKFIIPLIRNEHNYGVKLGKDVEIGLYNSICRGSWRDTVIGDGTKLDHHIHVGHNAIIGENCLLVSFSNIGGSAEIGNRCYIGMSSVIQDHVKITDNVTIGSMTNVIKDITEKNTTWIGNPARKLYDYQAYYDNN